jgi:triacylglycerol esterase/lipase EstA (alpha/beta hydrolase family)
MAHVQQALTLAALLFVLLWAAVSVLQGLPWWAPWGGLMLSTAYAGILGLEFVLLAVVHDADPTPQAQPAQLLRAWWRELLYAPLVFCWRQPFQSQRYPDYLPADAQGRRGVLLVHGFVCNRGLWNPWLQRLRAAGVPTVAVTVEPPFGSIDEGIAAIDEAVQQLEACTGLAPVLVGHSMGGLSIRRWWAERGSEARVHHAITLGTPHRGTWLARFAFSRNARQMRQGSSWLQMLAARESAAHRQRFTCFYSHCDNIVFPPRLATLCGANNQHLPGVAHVHMVSRPEPWQALMACLDQPAP